VAGSVIVTGLREPLAGYLELRRSLGFSLKREEKLLGQFITWLEDSGATTIATADALAWVTLPADASPGWLKFRMHAVRGFAAYLQTTDPDAEIPPPGLLPGGPRRAVPYLYSPADIDALLARAGQLKTPLRQETLKTLISLMAVTGMRGGEVVALDDEDFDADRGLLLVRHAKLGKHRLLPLHPTTVTALLSYRQLRNQRFPRPRSEALLVSSAGTRLLYYNVGQTFARLARQAGLAARSGGCRPRPHDLRHSFAVATLLDWCRDDADIAARLPLLSAYLGHAAPAHTYWYLQASPELLAEAARRLAVVPGQPQ
jgi:integrase/recombinase XerD